MSEEGTNPGEPTVRGLTWGERFCTELSHMRLLALHTVIWDLISTPGIVDSLVFLNLPYLVNSFPDPEHTVLGEPGRSCAWGRDEFCISTSVLQQVQSVEQKPHRCVCMCSTGRI